MKEGKEKIKEKVNKLTKLLCEWNKGKWNKKESELVYKISKLFKKEFLEEWNEELFVTKEKEKLIKDYEKKRYLNHERDILKI